MGNVNWMRARESQLDSALFGPDLRKALPAVRPGGSDSATLDNVLELLTLAGRSLPHALMMMIPEAWEDSEDLEPELRAFYEFHSCLMEPWDGPAAVAFTDGRVVGATLDRNGLRPGRWVHTRDGYVVMASEAGVLPMSEELVVRKGRLQPRQAAAGRPGGRSHRGGRRGQARGGHAPALRRVGRALRRALRRPARTARDGPRLSEPRDRLQLAFGYSQEDLQVLLAPMAATGQEPLGSMGNDLALAVLSDRQPPLFSYFKQLFAQVTNPPIDPIREAVVMSLRTAVGSEGNLLAESPEHAHQLMMRQPDPALPTSWRSCARSRTRCSAPPRWTSPGRSATGSEGMEQRDHARVCARPHGGDRGRRQHRRPVRPRGQRRASADPVAAGRRRRPPPPGARGHAAAGRPGGGVGRAA